MSDRSFSGFVTVEDQGLTGMITLRADLSDAGVAQALSSAGVEVPAQGMATGGEFAGVGTLWMSPDELMVLCAHEAADGKAAELSAALGGRHGLVLNVSDARCVFRLTGPGASIREVLAKLSPADLRAAAMPTGRVRRTRLAQVPAAFWFTSEDEALLICFRSVSDYVFGLLKNAAAPGSEVGHF